MSDRYLSDRPVQSRWVDASQAAVVDATRRTIDALVQEAWNPTTAQLEAAHQRAEQARLGREAYERELHDTYTGTYDWLRVVLARLGAGDGARVTFHDVGPDGAEAWRSVEHVEVDAESGEIRLW